MIVRKGISWLSFAIGMPLSSLVILTWLLVGRYVTLMTTLIETDCPGHANHWRKRYGQGMVGLAVVLERGKRGTILGERMGRMR